MLKLLLINPCDDSSTKLMKITLITTYRSLTYKQFYKHCSEFYYKGLFMNTKDCDIYKR